MSKPWTDDKVEAAQFHVRRFLHSDHPADIVQAVKSLMELLESSDELGTRYWSKDWRRAFAIQATMVEVRRMRNPARSD